MAQLTQAMKDEMEAGPSHYPRVSMFHEDYNRHIPINKQPQDNQSSSTDYIDATEHCHNNDDDDDDDESDSYDTDEEEEERCSFLYEPSLVDFASLPSRAYDKAEEIAHKAEEFAHKAEEIAHKVWEAGWTVLHHNHLPRWLRDNDFLIKGHRPPMNSFRACFKSIFRIHTETGNIWTHLLGFVAFAGVASYFLSRPSIEIQWQDKLVFSAFFFGAILCMGFSWVFHTLYCHSEGVGKFFNKLDYCGIALLTMGSFVPWLYYSFYCRIEPKITYLILIIVLGTAAIVVSMWDKFATPKFRAVRAGTFIALGLSGIVPAMHYVITDGFYEAINFAALGWLVLMAVLYITGAVIYAVRIPERIWPGKFDIWFQSHQIFHMFVVAAAFIHLHGITQSANYRLSLGDCVDGDFVLHANRK